MNNEITCVAQKNYGAQYKHKQQNLVSSGNLHIRVQEILADSFQIDGAQYDTNLQTVLAGRNIKL